MSFLNRLKDKAKDFKNRIGDETVGKTRRDAEEEIETSVRPQRVKAEEHIVIEEAPVIDPSVYELDDDDFLGTELFSPKVTDEDIKKKTEDLLESLGIENPLTIPQNTMIPEDFADISIDFSAPVGYDRGQVDGILSQAKSSMSSYISMLNRRNEDINRLAREIEKVQAENLELINNAEAAQGITVLSQSSGISSIEYEAQIAVLKDELRRVEKRQGDALSDNERQEYEDTIARLESHTQELEKENTRLSQRIVGMEGQMYSHLNSIDDNALPDLVDESLPDIDIDMGDYGDWGADGED